MNQETKSTNCPLRGAIKRVIIQLRKLIKLILSQNGFPIVQMRLRTTAKSLAIRRCRIKDVENRGVLVGKKIRCKTQEAQCRNDWQSRAMFDIGFHRLESSWIDWGQNSNWRVHMPPALVGTGNEMFDLENPSGDNSIQTFNSKVWILNFRWF